LSKVEIKLITAILFRNYNFFKDLKESLNRQKMSDIINIINIESLEMGERVIKYGK